MSTDKTDAPDTRDRNREILLGGRMIDVQLKPTVDESNPSDQIQDLKSEQLKVLFVPLLKMNSLLRAYGKFDSECMVYSGKDSSYLERLTDSSVLEILKVGRELNDPLFKSFLEQQEKSNKMLETLTGDSNSELREAVIGLVREEYRKNLEGEKDSNS